MLQLEKTEYSSVWRRRCFDSTRDTSGTHERYETGRKGFELKTSDSINL